MYHTGMEENKTAFATEQNTWTDNNYYIAQIPGHIQSCRYIEFLDEYKLNVLKQI